MLPSSMHELFLKLPLPGVRQLDRLIVCLYQDLFLSARQHGPARARSHWPLAFATACGCNTYP